ncbi:hypothetical protein Q7C36_023541 [Tachysurus vachellii]|uniref:Uncharacterized protein n=1 Tax=Tachysurus vachellii TaxID=175792 RepID=A0AA88IF36_TACVA|nr:uncharacterized protein LOC132840420 isoform X3 [Tachysurus vachellii]KAK2815275.1 hypothetical protein Q7C36_023541 [Tachysurus vachellii]
MSFPLNASFLNTSEASVIESAVRTAVMSILKVFCELNDKRSQCYEEKLTEAQRQNTALKIQLKAAEQELHTLRQISTDYSISAEVTLSQDLSSDVREEQAGFHSGADLLIKEEPSYENTSCFKSEVTDERSAPECDYQSEIHNVQVSQQTPGAEMWNMHHEQTFSSARSSINQTRQNWIPGDVLTGKLKSRECVRRYRERIRADPEKYHAWKEKERLRRKRIQDLPEPMQRLQREAWREATRRHRARKSAQATVSATDVTPTLDP